MRSPSVLPAASGAARGSPADPRFALRRGRALCVGGPDALAGEAVHRRASRPAVGCGPTAD